SAAALAARSTMRCSSKAGASHALESSTVTCTGPTWLSRQICTVAARAAVHALLWSRARPFWPVSSDQRQSAGLESRAVVMVFTLAHVGSWVEHHDGVLWIDVWVCG